MESITLLAVSKTVAPDRVRESLAAGQRRFGENYVAEAVPKMEALAAERGAIEWHLIGPLQSNKTRLVAERFDWVHSVDRLRIAERLSAQRPPGLAPLQVCLQVDIGGEATKSGFDPDGVLAAARAVARLPGLALRGLMAVPALAAGEAAQRLPHRALKALFDAVRADGIDIDTLSMGMSDDLEAAVLEGSTLLRVGSAIFGARGGPERP